MPPLTVPSLLDAYLLENGLGARRLAVALKGTLPLGDGREAPPQLVLTDRGLYVVGITGDGAGGALDVGATELRYLEGVVGDTLLVGAFAFGVPTGKGDDVRRALAVGRVAPLEAHPYEGLLSARHIEPITEVEARWLGGWLEGDEVLLAWLETASTVDVPSSVMPARCPLRFLLTDRRASLVAISPVGDVITRPLEGAGLEMRRLVGRDVASLGGVEWAVPLVRSLYAELAPLASLGPEERVREIARLNWIAQGKRQKTRVAARALLARLDERGDALGIVLARSLEEQLEEKLEERLDERLEEREGLEHGEPMDVHRRARSQDEALLELVQQMPSSSDLAKVWRAWKLPIAVGMSWLEALLAASEGARRWAVELHTILREALLESSDDRFAHAAIDIAYAEHLLTAGRNEEAQVVLEARLEALPSEELFDLLPPDDVDLTEGSGGQRFRTRILELLVEARGTPGEQDGGTLLELAQLQPLVPARLQAVVDVGEGHARQAARHVLAVLERGGLAPLDAAVDAALDATTAAAQRPLSKKRLFGTLQHPAAREGHPLGKLQAILGSVRAPDHSALQAYCERLERDGAAQRALNDASVVLGVPGVAGYVSRGDRAIGVRAYEGPVPFVLVGGRHLEAGSDYAMHPWELRFAIAAEVAHLRFRHSRLTKSEVWGGVFEKGRFGFDVIFGMLPVFKGIGAIDKVWEIIERYKKGPLGRVMRGLDVAEKAVTKVRGKRPEPQGRPREQLVAAPNERLVAAHRVMQLTADRAGLLLAGDLGAAIRSMFLASHAYRAELPVAEQHGLLATLSRRDDDEQMVFQDLAIRVAALIGFYLCDDYPRLCELITAQK